MDLKNEKISIISHEPKMKRADIIIFLEKKIVEFQNTINETILSAQTYKRLEIIGASELNVCITTLEELYERKHLNHLYLTVAVLDMIFQICLMKLGTTILNKVLI